MAIGRQHTLAAAWVLGRAAAPAWAAAPDYQAVNTALVEDYVIPRYAAFAQATAALEGALAAACEDGRPTPEEAGAAYHNAMDAWTRSEEHTSELQSLMRISYAVFCLKKKNKNTRNLHNNHIRKQA